MAGGIAYGTFSHGRKSSIGTTAVQITTTDTAVRRGVLVKSSNENGTNKLYVGNSSAVTADSADGTDGYELGTGEAVVIEVDNATKVWVIADAGAANKVFWLGL